MCFGGPLVLQLQSAITRIYIVQPTHTGCYYRVQLCVSTRCDRVQSQSMTMYELLFLAPVLL